MAKLSNVDIPIAVSNHVKLDLSCDHDTTMDFLKCQPVCYRHMIKGEHLNFSALATVRPAPMAIPTYGRMRLNLRGFFVSYSNAMPLFDQFYHDVIASDKSQSSLISGVPYTTNKDIVLFFMYSVGGLNFYITEVTDATQIANHNWDFCLDGITYYKFNPIARPWVKILKSLGYRINWNTKDETPISMLPFLCLAKIYFDWYANSQYLDSAAVLRLQQLLNYNDPVSPLYISTEADFSLLFGLISTCVYDDNSYFVNAWDSPVSPTLNQITPITSFSDIASGNAFGYSTIESDSNGTPVMVQSDSADYNIGSQYIHDSLKKLTNLVKRRQLAGSRVIDRALSQFGAASERIKVNRSIYVGSQSIDINVGDVMSTANTSSGPVSSLGDYAGKGFGQGSKSWDFVADEMGMFIVIASILPSSGYYQGMDRHNLHLSKFDFFVPELDSLGVQAIQKRELYVSENGNFGGAMDYDASFGFTGRYGEFKRPISWVSGDIDLKSVMLNGDAWHLNRVLSDQNFVDSLGNPDIDEMVHSLDFTRGIDGKNFDRIFNYVGNDIDHFFCHFHFDMGAYSPCKPLFETYDFEESSRKVTLTSNGTKLN